MLDAVFMPQVFSGLAAMPRRTRTLKHVRTAPHRLLNASESRAAASLQMRPRVGCRELITSGVPRLPKVHTRQ